MTTFWIVTSHKFIRHASLEAAEAERARIAAKCPDKTFTVVRCKENPQPAPVFREMLDALKGCISYRNWQIAEGGVVPDELIDTFKRAEAAVNKAEGQTT